MVKPTLCIILAAVALQPAALGVELTAPNGYYIQYSPDLLTPDEGSIFKLKDLTKKYRSSIKAVFDGDREDLKLLDAEIKRQSEHKWLQMQKLLSQEQITKIPERAKRKGHFCPTFVDTALAGSMTQDQQNPYLILRGNDTVFALEKRRNAIVGKQIKLIKPMLTDSQLAELQYQN